MYEEQTNDHKCKERDCGAIFQMTDRQERYFTDKGLFIPKRCGSCRKKRREAKEVEARQQ